MEQRCNRRLPLGTGDAAEQSLAHLAEILPGMQANEVIDQFNRRAIGQMRHLVIG
jgi:hypothetical protein